MNPYLAEIILRRAGGILAYASLAIVFYGIWRGTHRPSGRTSGRAAGWLRSALFYFLATAGYVGISIGFWKPLPLDLPSGVVDARAEITFQVVRRRTADGDRVPAGR